jgi:intracellular sulfur oxidation DsrE/DsrF family protein
MEEYVKVSLERFHEYEKQKELLDKVKEKSIIITKTSNHFNYSENIEVLSNDEAIRILTDKLSKSENEVLKLKKTIDIINHEKKMEKRRKLYWLKSWE